MSVTTRSIEVDISHSQSGVFDSRWDWGTSDGETPNRHEVGLTIIEVASLFRRYISSHGEDPSDDADVFTALTHWNIAEISFPTDDGEFYYAYRQAVEYKK